jgi:transcriptional regulator GlxA family with amidase domain
MGILTDHRRPPTSGMDARIETVLHIMRQSFAEQLSVSTLSAVVNLSPTRLRQLFKHETGRSPMRFLKDLRLQRARQLLDSTFLSVKEVTSLVGLEDVSHFVRDFKKQYGLTPTEFRRRHWSKRDKVRSDLLG